MPKKSKKKFKISRDDLNIKIDEYLENGGKITKLECIIPEGRRTVLQESQIRSDNVPVIDQDYFTKSPAEKEAKWKCLFIAFRYYWCFL